MRRVLVNYTCLYFSNKPISHTSLVTSTHYSNFKFLSSSSHNNNSPNPKTLKPTHFSENEEDDLEDYKDGTEQVFLDDVEDVTTKDFKAMIEKYYEEDHEESIPLIYEAILRRKLLKKHEDSDNELMEEIMEKPIVRKLPDVKSESESDSESD